MAADLRTRTAAATDVGRKRSHNEDHHALWVAAEHGGSAIADVLLVVADGMGGASAGEVASRMAVDTVLRVVSTATSGPTEETLRRAVETANREVFDHSQSQPLLDGMGTTCTTIALRNNRASFAHVGDSRAYLVRNGKIRQLTHDHSLIARLVEQHELTPQEARVDPRRNVVTRSVGVAESVEVEAGTLDAPLEPGDTLLLCSDGLHGQVTDTELAQAGSRVSIDEACHELIRLANHRGGPDNITVLMARIETDHAPAFAPAPAPAAHAPAASGVVRQRKALKLLITAIVALVLTLCGIVLLLGQKLQGRP